MLSKIDSIGVVTRFTYSPERRWLTRIETLAPGGTPYTYTRDKAGRITRIDGLTAAESGNYTYDDLDQLLSACPPLSLRALVASIAFAGSPLAIDR